MRKNEAVSAEEVAEKPDKKFKGPLSYRHLKILGWLCLAAAQVGSLFRVGAYFDAWTRTMNDRFFWVFAVIGNLAVPLFLVANFAVILNRKRKYRNLLLTYGGLAVLVCIAFYFAVEHYLVGVFDLMIQDTAVARESVLNLMNSLAVDGFWTFNVFIDLFLCTLLSYFINYNPTRFFRGKKLYLFRSFAFLPLLYEVATFVLKVLANLSVLRLPPYVFPLLPTKPPMMFVLFLALVVVFKVRERKYLKQGHTHAQYLGFIRSNTNSWHFSVWLMILMIATAAVDLLLLAVLPFTLLRAGDYTPELFGTAYRAALDTVNVWGFGNSVMLFFLAPFLLLFSYSKSYKEKNGDTLIPIFGFGLIALIYLEGAFQMVCHMFEK